VTRYKLQFIHTVNGDGSETANTKEGTINHTNIDIQAMLVWLIVLFMIFAVFDPSPLTMCINCSFCTYIIVSVHFALFQTLGLAHAAKVEESTCGRRDTSLTVVICILNGKCIPILIITTIATDGCMRTWTISSGTSENRTTLTVTRTASPCGYIRTTSGTMKIAQMQIALFAKIATRK